MAHLQTRTGIVVLTAAMATAVVGVRGFDQRQRPGIQQPSATYGRAEAEVIASRLYRAVLGREGDAGGLSTAVAEIQRGNLRTQVDGMVRSPEFVQKERDRNPAQILEQFFQGLLGRKPDSAGVSAFLPRVQGGQYTSVLLEMIQSPEFQQVLTTPGGGRPAQPTPPAAQTPSRLEAALECQARVIDRVRRDSPGRVFLSFDRMPDMSRDGQTVQGAAVDRWDGDRPMTYSCQGGQASYTYNDRRPARGGDRRMQFPSVAVKNCQVAVSPSAVFDAASLSATDTSAEYVLGLIGDTLYTCEMDRQRVASLKKK